MDKKYELTSNTKEWYRHTLHRIKALKSFGDVRKGDLGGWIEGYHNLSQTDTAWVDDNAMVWNNAYVCGNAKVGDNALVYGDAQVFGDAQVYGDAQVFDHAVVIGNATVHDNAIVYDDAKVWDCVEVYDYAEVGGNAVVSDSAKVYGDSKIQGSINIRENDDIKDNSSYLIFNNTWSSGRQFVYVLSNQRWHVGCFDGTGEELIKKAYRDSKLSGKMYEMYVHFAEQVAKAEQHN